MDGGAIEVGRPGSTAGEHGRDGRFVGASQTTGAGRAVKADAVVIRECASKTLDELRSCVALQKEIWNFSDAELVPLRMFVVAEKVGGQVMCAFDTGKMVGFAMSVPGTRSGRVYLHSHMLAVRKE